LENKKPGGGKAIRGGWAGGRQKKKGTGVEKVVGGSKRGAGERVKKFGAAELKGEESKAKNGRRKKIEGKIGASKRGRTRQRTKIKVHPHTNSKEGSQWVIAKNLVHWLKGSV